MNLFCKLPCKRAFLIAAALSGSFGIVAADPSTAFQPLIRFQTNKWVSFPALDTNTFEQLLKSAEQGDSGAQIVVGDAYTLGRVVASNAVEAAKWYRKAAEQTNAAGMFRIGSCLLTAHGVAKDEAGAFGWLLKSAEQDYAPSFAWVARSYETGLGGFMTNFPEALRWYLYAANANDDWAQYRLGALYTEGLAIKRDGVEALKWYELAGKDGKQFAESARTEGAALAAALSVPEVVEARRRASAFVPHVLRPSGTSSPARDVNSEHASRVLLPAPVVQKTRPAVPATPKAIEIPIELQNNRPIVSIRVNDSKPLRLLFDSGSGLSILTEKAASKLNVERTEKKIMFGSEIVDSLEGLAFHLAAGASYRPRTVVLHPMKSQRMLDPFLDGILGADLFEHFVVELDYRAKRMRLRALNKYKYTGPGENVLMRFNRGRPWIGATLVTQDGRTLKGQFLVDTGASVSLYITSDFANYHSLHEAAAGKTLAGRTVVFSGTEKTRIGRFKSLHIAHFLIEEPEVIFAQETEESGPFGQLSGVIGGEILRRFTVTFHYGRQQLSLEPSGQPPRPTQSRVLGSELLN